MLHFNSNLLIFSKRFLTKNLKDKLFHKHNNIETKMKNFSCTPWTKKAKCTVSITLEFEGRVRHKSANFYGKICNNLCGENIIGRYYTFFFVASRTFFRALSLFDLLTDFLLYQKFQKNGEFWLSTILFLSICAPFFVSYSSGVKLFMTNGKLQQTEGFLIILPILFLFPTGVLYFVLIDCIEILLSLVDAVAILQGERFQQLRLREELWAKQLGMTRMDWEVLHSLQTTVYLTFLYSITSKLLQLLLLFFFYRQGFKRQRAVSHLMLESLLRILFLTNKIFGVAPFLHIVSIEDRKPNILIILYILSVCHDRPQLIIQGLVASGVIKSALSVSNEALYLSMLSAATNVTFQTIRIKMEAQTVRENWLQYTVNCIMARIDWTPYLHEIDEIRLKKLSMAHTIDYNHMKICNLCMCFEPNMVYDFSDVSIKLTTIKMGKACKLVSIHSVVQLMEACKDRVTLDDIHDPEHFPWQQCINLAAKEGRDIRISSYAYLQTTSQPLLIALLNSGFDEKGKIFQLLLQNGAHTHTHKILYTYMHVHVYI
ncbi:hypothetical protein RFI_07084 [Reticulomyxa filosa]|uniref:Uncharacterized protein n=1 Tax=Reticulomyxa filosa TaxID=46433 RepID=X6NW35_RETFI|nr:hypothetical protein RFI_07084 [Reticulomyxa filosa]|eukprot:ETO30039.1 hypothetical protein RFI_07084 [Reticulomyxa filosa]